MELSYAIGATIIVSLISFVGIAILFKNLSSKNLVLTALISFAAGSLLGDAFIHLLGESVEKTGYNLELIFSILFGILVMLIIEAIIHCSHDSANEIEDKPHHLSKMNIIGDGVHNFLDGIAIAASFLVSPEVGIATTIAVILHEIPQELADVSVLIYSGWGKRKVLIINFLTALMAVFGALFAFGLSEFSSELEKYLVPFAAGQFIYIALADLLPVIHKKSGIKKYLVEILMFILGIGIMFALTFVE